MALPEAQWTEPRTWLDGEIPGSEVFNQHVRDNLRWLYRNAGGFVNALDFGAVGDDSTDDSSAIQDAMDTLSAKGGGTVIAPNKHRAVALNVPANVTLTGGTITLPDGEDDRNITALVGDDSAIKDITINGNGVSRHCVQIVDTILRGLVDGVHCTNTGTGGDGVRCGSASNDMTNAAIINCRFSSIGRNDISVVSGRKTRIAGNDGEGNLQIETIQYARDILVIGNQFFNSNCSLSRTRRVKVSYVANTFHGRNDAGNSIKAAGNGDTEIIISANACFGGIEASNGRNINVTENICKYLDVTNPGDALLKRINLSSNIIVNVDEGADDPQITPGSVDDAVILVRAGNSDHVTIRNNLLNAIGLSGIISRAGTNQIWIDGNLIRDDSGGGNYGVRVYNTACEDLHIINNDISGFANPIELNDVTRPTIEGNDYHGNVTPIAFTNCPEIKITDRVDYSLSGTNNSFRTGSIFRESFTWDPPSVANGDATSGAFTISGVEIGDIILPPSHDQIGSNRVLIGGQVESANSVRVTMANFTGGSLDLASGILLIEAIKA